MLPWALQSLANSVTTVSVLSKGKLLGVQIKPAYYLMCSAVLDSFKNVKVESSSVEDSGPNLKPAGGSLEQPH